jgi:hypothetical protein
VPANGDDNQLVLSYLALRRAVGVLGVMLPGILPIGVLLLSSGTGLQDSISAYYNTVMRGVFVGVLFAIGVFLFTYQGYERFDNIAGNLACVFALGVALFPVTSGNSFVRSVHFLSATALFLTLSYFSLFLFTKSKAGATRTPKKETRNKVYVVCGIFMLACIVLIAVFYWFLQETGIGAIRPVFWLEGLALWAFDWSWFVKGEGLKPLNDGG